MTDKITKELAKLSAKERRLVKEVLSQLKGQDVKGLQISKLKGHKSIFRVRKGNLRIIYQEMNGSTIILVIERRSESTYKDF